jgi:NADP-dependent 3-hydroxy acid dehydrogenase YdfG
VSSGFGRIMTEQLLARGDRIAGTVRDLSVMNDLKAEYGDRLWLAELDLSETAAETAPDRSSETAERVRLIAA